MDTIIEQQGKRAAESDIARKTEMDKQRVDNLIKSSNNILISANSLLSIFPSTISVDTVKVYIIHRQFFSSQANSVDIRDINEVLLERGVIFSQLTINSSTFANNRESIARLNTQHAIKVRKIIDGLRVLAREGINPSNFSNQELFDKLLQLGS